MEEKLMELIIFVDDYIFIIQNNPSLAKSFNPLIGKFTLQFPKL